MANRYGGRENLDAIEFLRQLNTSIGRLHPGALTFPEESTAFPGELITFSFMYAWSERFVLPISHDEVVHGKRSLLDKMPGDEWQKRANYRWLLAYMMAHPGKKLLFMGQEFGQWREWRDEHSLDWHQLGDERHRGLQRLNRELNRLYTGLPALYAGDAEPAGFAWIDLHNAEQSVFAFLRRDPSSSSRPVVCAFNATPVPRDDYRIGVPEPGVYQVVLDTDAASFGGSAYAPAERYESEREPSHGYPHRLRLTLPPLAALYLVPAA
jgi:1,4-alpha-glucan branching enzyme